MARFSFRPSLTIKGRTFMGLRGFSGKPFHPPLTDVPVGAYMLAVGLDVLSWIGGAGHGWTREFYRSGTFVLIGGGLVSLGAALTGFMDWLKSTPKGTQARRTANAHAVTMLTVTALVLIDIVVRLGSYHDPSTPTVVAVLTVLAGLLTVVGGTIGGSLVFDYGFNVKTAGDSPAWHESDRDLLPGEKP